MKDTTPNVLARKASILIPILVIIPLIGFGPYVVPNLLDTVPPILTVIGLEKDQRYRGSLTVDIAAMDAKTGVGSLTVQVEDISCTDGEQ